MPDGRVNIAFASTWNDTTPTWTRIDNTDSLVSRIEIRRGRQTELEQTETSTATVYVNDTDGRFFSRNSAGPYYSAGLDGKQIALGLWNPFEEEWVQQFWGIIDSYDYEFAPVAPLVRVRIEFVGIFDYLAGVEILPDIFGDATNSDGAIVYQEEDFQSRLEHLAQDAGLTSTQYSFFTGNVDLQETKYDPGDSILTAMRDAVDAEFAGGVAQLYEDKLGRCVGHGRMARFAPDTVSFGTDWNYTNWAAGDGTAITADPTLAQIRPPLTWSRPRRLIYNAAIAYPRGMTESLMGGQVVLDSSSITDYGYRSWSARDLITLEGTTTGNTGEVECRLFAEYIVANYSLARDRVDALTFKSLHPDDPRAEATWALIAGMDISDTITLIHDYPGSAIPMFSAFFVEGSEMTITPLGPDFDMVELSVNVSPFGLLHGKRVLVTGPAYHGRTHVPGGTDPIPGLTIGGEATGSFQERVLAEPSLVAYWPADDASGDALDASGNGLDLDPVDTPTYGEPGPLADSAATLILVEGVNHAGTTFTEDAFERTTALTNTTLNPGTPMSVEIILYPTAYAAIADGVVQHGDEIATYYNMNIRPDGQIFWQPGTEQVASGVVLPLLTWTHIVGTASASAGCHLYFNGVLVGSSANVTVGAGGTNRRFAIGGMTTAASQCRYYKGRWAQAAIYNTALTATQVANHYNAGVVNDPRYSSVRAVTATYAVTASDHIILANGTFTVTLPTAVGIAGRMYTIKNTGAGTITVAQTGSETTDGSTTDTTIATTKAARTFMSDGLGWQIIDGYL